MSLWRVETVAFTVLDYPMSWIELVGTIFYLMYAINHGVPAILAEQLIGFTLTTVAASIVLHGISVTPLMTLYTRRRAGQRR